MRPKFKNSAVASYIIVCILRTSGTAHYISKQYIRVDVQARNRVYTNIVGLYK